MPHHGSEPVDHDALRKALGMPASDEARKRLEAELGKLGETGQFPHGKIGPTDEGEIRFAVGNGPGKVLVEFGKPVAWLGLNPDDARGLADLLCKHAEQAEARRE